MTRGLFNVLGDEKGCLVLNTHFREMAGEEPGCMVTRVGLLYSRLMGQGLGEGRARLHGGWAAG